jgi:dihydrofolate reductase
MARILGYIATSLDGLIATEDDNLDWLFKYDDMNLGEHDYRAFLKRIRTVVMGRGTYDFIAREPSPGPMGTSASSSSHRGRLTIRRGYLRSAAMSML